MNLSVSTTILLSSIMSIAAATSEMDTVVSSMERRYFHRPAVDHDISCVSREPILTSRIISLRLSLFFFLFFPLCRLHHFQHQYPPPHRHALEVHPVGWMWMETDVIGTSYTSRLAVLLLGTTPAMIWTPERWSWASLALWPMIIAATALVRRYVSNVKSRYYIAL